LKTDEPIFLKIGTSGHTTPKLHLDAWRRHHSRQLRSTRFSG